jgi:hypothetical protein
MGRYTFVSVLLFTVLAVAVGVFVLPGKKAEDVHLPWQMSVTPDGNLRVLGVEVGASTLNEAEHAFKEPAEVSLFVKDSGEKAVEAYFNSVDISGLRARIVIVMDVDNATMQGMFERGVRVANMGGGRHKATLSDEDLSRLKQMPIASLTYIPKIDLNAELVQQRFGQPAERIAEPEGKVEHWLYPEKGLDIALDEEGDEVLQYVPPRDFDQISVPLHKTMDEAK